MDDYRRLREAAAELLSEVNALWVPFSLKTDEAASIASRALKEIRDGIE